MVDTGLISSVASNPIQRQAIVDLLVIDDIAGYEDADGYHGGYEPAGFSPALMSSLGVSGVLGVSPGTETALTTPPVDLAAIHTDLTGGLNPAETTIYTTFRDRLTQTQSSADLMPLLQEVRGHATLSANAKQVINDLLVLDDIAGYTNSSGTFVPGYEPAGFSPDLMATLNPASYFGVSPQTETALTTAPVDLQAIQQGLEGALTADGTRVYEYLRTRLSLAQRRTDLIGALCTLDASQTFCPTVSGLTPDEVRANDSIDATISGTNLPTDAEVVSNDPLVTVTVTGRTADAISVTIAAAEGAVAEDDAATADIRENLRTLRITSPSYPGFVLSLENVLTILPGNEGTCEDTLDNDHDGAIDDLDPDCAAAALAAGGAGEQDLEGADLASYYLHNVLMMDLILALGGSSYTSGTVDGDTATPPLPTQLRPALSTLYPNIGLTLNMGNIEQNRPVTIIGQHNPIAPGVAPSWFDLMYDIQFGYASYLQQAGSAGDEHMVDLGVGLQGRFRPQGNVYLDAFFGYDLDYNNFTTPNRLYFSGMDHQIHAGGAFGTDFGQDFLDARVFGRYERSWFSYDQATFGLFEFDGQREGLRLGLRLDVDGSSLSDNAPDGYLQASVLPWGNTYVPEYAPSLGIDSHSLESTRAFNAELGIAWREWAINPFLIVGATSFWQGDADLNEEWNPMYNIYGTAGVDTEVAGRFELGLLLGRNITLFSGGEQTGGSFTWTLPVLNRSFSLMGRIDQFSMGEYEELSGGGMLLWDPLRTFLPVPPQGYDQ